MIELAAVTISVLAPAGYAYRADFARYSVFTVGVFERVERATVDPTTTDGIDDNAELAERRRYWREVVVAGMPTLRYDRGVSHYSGDAVSFETQQTAESSDTEELPTTLAHAVVDFTAWVLGGDVATDDFDVDDDSPFVDAAKDTTVSVWEMFPAFIIAGVVLFVVALTNLFGHSVVPDDTEKVEAAKERDIEDWSELKSR